VFSMANLIPGDWYITIVCACGERLILFADLTKGTGTLVGSFVVTCPACGERGSFNAEHYHHDPSVEPSPIISHAVS
jgi:hypothetical protein